MGRWCQALLDAVNGLVPILAERLTRTGIRYNTAGMTIDVPGNATGPPTLSEHVSAEIRADLGRQGISQRQLAVRLGVSPMWVSGRLSGETAISLDDLVLMASGLGRSVSFFLPGSVTDVLDVEVIKSRPLRSRPARHAKSGVKPTARYFSRPDRPSDRRPKGRPDAQAQLPNLRRPVWIDSTKGSRVDLGSKRADPDSPRAPDAGVGQPPATAFTHG